MSAWKPNTNQIDVSNEAKLRWLHRVDPSETNPAARIRELLSEATPSRQQVTDAIGWQVEDLVLVTDTDAEVVQTVLQNRGDGQ
jgi:hypothetical protein